MNERSFGKGKITVKTIIPATRPANSDDAKMISHVLAKCCKEIYKGIIDDDCLDALAPNTWTSYLDAGLREGSLFSIVMEEDDEMIGVAVLRETEYRQEVELVSIYLLPEHIGKGLGAQLYREVEARCRALGYTSCVLEIIDGNNRATEFYRECGFSITGGTHTADFEHGLGTFRVFGMRKHYAAQ